jgi:hypothetical protein
MDKLILEKWVTCRLVSQIVNQMWLGWSDIVATGNKKQGSFFYFNRFVDFG